MALRVAAMTPGSGVHAPRAGSESTKVTAFHSRALRSGAVERAESIPRDTAAATSAADWKPCRVACVTRHDDHTASAKASGSAVDTAMPMGVTRMAAPFVVPSPPTASGSSPPRTRSSAALVDGPKRSSDPRSIMESSQASRAWANSCASRVTRAEEPRLATRRDATSSACSVSSVTEPAAMPGA